MTLADSVLKGDIRSLARAATMIEAQSDNGRQLSETLFAATGNALTIGVTGAPGAGKSTLVNSLIRSYRGDNKTVGVVAVDPSSPFSHGALLGDRVRMLEHYADPDVFIRSTATRGRLGGLAATTMDLVLLMDAAKRQVILIETVGVGQDEIDIAHLAAVTLVVLAPGAGDDIQALKAGILEIADIIVINKADLPGSDRLYEDILEAQNLSDSQAVPVCRVSAIASQGVPPLLEQINSISLRKYSATCETDTWSHRLRLKLRDDLMTHLPEHLLTLHAQRVAAKIEDPEAAINALKAELLAQSKHVD